MPDRKRGLSPCLYIASSLLAFAAFPAHSGTFVPIGPLNVVSSPGAAQHNIPANARGNGQGFALAATKDDGTLQYFHINNQFQWDRSYQLLNNYGVVGEYSDASPALMAKDTSNMHVFAVTRQKYTEPWMLSSCLMINGQQDYTDHKRWRDLMPVTYASANSFGAAEVPDASGVVFVVPDASLATATVAYFRWGPGTDPALTKVVQQTIPMPPGLQMGWNGYDGGITAALTRNYDKMARYHPYRLTLAVDPGNGAQVLTRDFRVNTKLPDNLLPSFFVTSIPTADDWQPVGTATSQRGARLHEGVDGSLNLVFFQNGVLTQYRRTGFDPQTQATVWSSAPSLSDLRAASLPAFVYRPFNTQNKEIFDINRLALYHRVDGSSYGIGGYDTLFGKGKRRPLGTTTLSSGALVLGIVDGPPPIPNENLAWVETETRPYELVASETRFGFSQTSQQSISSSVEHGFTVGMNASIGGEIKGFGASIDLEREVREGHGSSYVGTDSSRSETFLTVGSNYQNITGNRYKVMPIGTMYVVKMAFTGFAYEYVDTNGNPVPGTRIYYQVFPTGGYNVVTENYWMNPNGRRPGELPSYMFDPEDPKDVAAKQALENASVIEFSGLMPGATQRYLTNHWQDATTVTTTWDYMKSAESSESTSARVSEALKASAKTPVGGIGGSVGQDSEITRSWTTGGSTSTGLAVDATVANQRDYPGIYWGCTFQTYLLKDDNAYLRELLSDDPNGIGLVTPTWPPIGSIQRQQNERVRDMLIRSSKPWKIQYVVTDIRFNTPLNAREPGLPALSPALLRKLRRFGVQTTGQADLLLQGKDAARPIMNPRGRNIPTRAAAAQQRRTTDERLSAIGRAFRSEAVYKNAVASLTPADEAALRRFLKAAEPVTRKRYQAEKPRRHPLFTPRAILDAPDIENKDPEYYFRRVPPAEIS